MKIRRDTLILEILVAALFFSVALYLGAQNEITNIPSTGTDIIAFGDSLVEGVGSERGGGFTKILAEDLGRPVINLGVRGNTTEDALDRIKVLDNYDPKIVIVLLGGNDYLSGASEENISQNLSRIIDEIHSRGAAVLLLGLQTSVLDIKHERLFKNLAEEKKVAYIPDIMRGILGNQRLMSDSLHPNDDGYKIMAERIIPVLKSLLE
jgi:lysophospholipase L1-like esterase